MINVKTAELYTSEQRKQICKWCKEQGMSKSCDKCGITITPPRLEKNGRSK